MTRIIELPKNEVTIESPGLSDDERQDLEVFLKAQPGIQDVSRRMYARDSAFDRDTIGFLTQIPWDLVVVVGNSVKEAAPYILPLLTVFLMARRDRIQEEKDRKQQEDENTERVPLLDARGRTIRIIKRPKSETAP
jgi:hypothetical protein